MLLAPGFRLLGLNPKPSKGGITDHVGSRLPGYLRSLPADADSLMKIRPDFVQESATSARTYLSLLHQTIASGTLSDCAGRSPRSWTGRLVWTRSQATWSVRQGAATAAAALST